MCALPILFLSQEDVSRCGALEMPLILSLVEEVFRLSARGDALDLHAPGLRWPGSERLGISSHAAYVGGDVEMAGIKWMTHNLTNQATRQMPNSVGLIVLNDGATGDPVAVMDGALISAMRTGAAAGVGAKHFAPEAAASVALIGIGPIGRAQLLAIHAAVPGLQHVRVYSQTPARSHSFAEEMRDRLQITVDVAPNAEEAIRGAAIIAPATHTRRGEAYIEADWIQPGAYMANLSGNDYSVETMVACDRIVIDHPKQLAHDRLQLSHLVRAGEVAAPIEIGHILNGDAAGRTHPTQRILFCPDGMGSEDVIVAAHVYRQARQLGIGTEVAL